MIVSVKMTSQPIFLCNHFPILSLHYQVWFFFCDRCPCSTSCAQEHLNSAAPVTWYLSPLCKKKKFSPRNFWLWGQCRSTRYMMCLVNSLSNYKNEIFGHKGQVTRCPVWRGVGWDISWGVAFGPYILCCYLAGMMNLTKTCVVVLCWSWTTDYSKTFLFFFFFFF